MSKKFPTTLIVIAPFLASCYNTSDLFPGPSFSDSCETLATHVYATEQMEGTKGVTSIEERLQLTKNIMIQKGCPSSIMAEVSNKLSNSTISTNNIPPSTATLSSLTSPAPARRIGVKTIPVTPRIMSTFGLSENHGAFVTATLPGSDAERAGIVAGDIILGVSGKSVANPEELIKAIAQVAPRSPADLQIWRNRESIDVNVTSSSASSNNPVNAPSIQALATPRALQKNAPQPATISATSTGRYCVSTFTKEWIGKEDKDASGWVTNVWKTEDTDKNSASNSMPKLESYVQSQGHNFDIETRSCQPPGAMEQCMTVGTKGFIDLRGYSLTTTCTEERQYTEAVRNGLIKQWPYMTVTDWNPVGSSQ